MSKFELKSDVVRGIIALVFVIGLLLYPILGIPVTPEILALCAMILGYYFARRANGDHAPKG